ncbi:MAG: beta-galactosidase [Bacteroides sp.]|nr:beta-galactosidase [Bacteroides sp.]
MKNLSYALLGVILILFSACQGSTGQKGTFATGDKTFLLNDEPFLVKAAELHYTRIPAEYWEHRIQMCKALGMNTICLYVFWNIHEQQEGVFDFKGQNDIAAFCKLAQKHGMWVIVRPGPYVCAEWEMGGLPWWLLKKQDIELRTLDPYYMERTEIFMKEVGKQIADLQITRGGNIIMVQVENEYGSYGTDKPYVSAIRDIVREAGFNEVPLFQCDWSSNFTNNALDDLIWTVNFGTGADIEQQFKKLEELRPESPLMCSEFWSGWFDHWGRKHETRDATAIVNGMKEMLDRNISLSLYMTHGGTTFGHWGGANSPAYSAMCSSYDYDAPISEAGWTTDKYFKLRDLLANYLPEGETLPEAPAAYPVIEIPEIAFTQVAPLFDNLPEAILSEDIKPMEQFNQGWGTILYRTILPEINRPTTLVITEPHDWAQVFVDGRRITTMDRRKGENKVELPMLAAGTQLDILVEAMGRVNFGKGIHDRKGITEKVELHTIAGTTELKNWQVYSFPVDSRFVKDKNYLSGEKQEGPAYYKATFRLKETGDVFFDMQNWGKGMVWVNGISIGRFWEIGPQQTLFMPGCWLKKGENEIIILDLKGPEQATVTGIKTPILDVLRQQKSSKNRKEGERLRLTGEKPVFEGKFSAGNGWQEIKFGKTIPSRYFCLEGLNAQDRGDIAAIAEMYVLGADGEPLSREAWKIVYADSEEADRGNHTADKVFDLQESTYWRTVEGVGYPHQIVIDLGQETEVAGFRYLPRAEEGAPGTIGNYKVYLRTEPFTY